MSSSAKTLRTAFLWLVPKPSELPDMEKASAKALHDYFDETELVGGKLPFQLHDVTREGLPEAVQESHCKTLASAGAWLKNVEASSAFATARIDGQSVY